MFRDPVLLNLIKPQVIIKLVAKMVINIMSALKTSEVISTGIEKNNNTVINPLGVIKNSGKIDFLRKNALSKMYRLA